MVIDRLKGLIKIPAGKEAEPEQPKVIALGPEAPTSPATDKDPVEGLFIKMKAPAIPEPKVELKDILGSPATAAARLPPPVEAPPFSATLPDSPASPAPQPAAATTPANAAPADDLMASIFQQEEKEENAALAELISSVPEVTMGEILEDISLVKELMLGYQNTDEIQPQEANRK